MAMYRDMWVDEPGGAGDGGLAGLADRSIGSIMAERRELDDAQIDKVLQYQREKGIRFGEAAIALGFATVDDVLYALSQQFHYPYAAEERRKLSPELIALNQPFSVQAEALRAIRSQVTMRLGLPNGQTQRHAIAVVSADSLDGKTFFAANLAVTLAQLGGRTLVVDADLRNPRQHAVFALDNTVGLSAMLSGRTEAKAIQPVPGVPSLFVLPVGITPPNPLELVERPAFALLMRELLAKFDHVIVDTPAAEHGADASVIASRCGAALLLARKGASKVTAVQDLAARVQDGGAVIAGAIVNEF